MWKRLYKKLEILPAARKPVPPPDDEDLNRFEARHSLKLPRSYRQFAKLFGPGEFAGYYRIATPSHRKKRSTRDLDDDLTFYASIRDVFSESYGDTEFVERMVPFSDTGGGDVIVWDPEDIRSKKDKDYGIYVLPRDNQRIIFLVDSFRSYVEKVCLGRLFYKKLPWLEGGTVDQTFCPFPEKRATSKKG